MVKTNLILKPHSFKLNKSINIKDACKSKCELCKGKLESPVHMMANIWSYYQNEKNKSNSLGKSK